MDPLPVVKTIQALAGTANTVEKSDVSVEELLKSMQIKLNYPRRLLLRFLIHRVRKGIANRERGKSVLILATHKYRLLFRQLAARMVQEGFLSDPDLLFFLVPSEILQLLETRSPKIIARATHRQRNRDIASKDIYPELSAGLPLKPVSCFFFVISFSVVDSRDSNEQTGNPQKLSFSNS